MSPEVILGSLMSLGIALSGWTLYTVHGLAVDAAASREKNNAQDVALHEDRARIIDVEKDVRDLQLDMAALPCPPKK